MVTLPGGSIKPRAMPSTTLKIDDRPAPEDCQTMADVRQGVDALDRALVTLLAERQRYMDAAARIKPTATRAGLSHDIAEPVWRTLIDRCIAHEYASFDAAD